RPPRQVALVGGARPTPSPWPNGPWCRRRPRTWPPGRRAGALVLHALVDELAQAFDARAHDLARLQEPWRLHAAPDATWRAGREDVARLERDDRARVLHDVGGPEQHVRGTSFLNHFAVDFAAHQ